MTDVAKPVFQLHDHVNYANHYGVWSIRYMEDAIALLKNHKDGKYAVVSLNDLKHLRPTCPHCGRPKELVYEMPSGYKICSGCDYDLHGR